MAMEQQRKYMGQCPPGRHPRNGYFIVCRNDHAPEGKELSPDGANMYWLQCSACLDAFEVTNQKPEPPGPIRSNGKGLDRHLLKCPYFDVVNFTWKSIAGHAKEKKENGDDEAEGSDAEDYESPPTRGRRSRSTSGTPAAKRGRMSLPAMNVMVKQERAPALKDSRPNPQEKDQFLNNCAYLAAEHGLSLDFFESPSFKKLVGNLRPGFKTTNNQNLQERIEMVMEKKSVYTLDQIKDPEDSTSGRSARRGPTGLSYNILSDTDHDITLGVDLPGVRAEKCLLTVEQNGRILRLTGSRQRMIMMTEDDTKVTQFDQKMILFPGKDNVVVDPTQIEANLADGVMVITALKDVNATQPQTIAVTSNPHTYETVEEGEGENPEGEVENGEGENVEGENAEGAGENVEGENSVDDFEEPV